MVTETAEHGICTESVTGAWKETGLQVMQRNCWERGSGINIMVPSLVTGDIERGESRCISFSWPTVHSVLFTKLVLI